MSAVPPVSGPMNVSKKNNANVKLPELALEEIPGIPGEVAVNVPAVNIPKINVPKVNVPKVNVPKVNIPKVNVPVVNVPKVNVPKMNLPPAPMPDMEFAPEEKGFFGKIGNALTSVMGTAKQAVGLEGGRRRVSRKGSKKSRKGSKKSRKGSKKSRKGSKKSRKGSKKSRR